MASTEQTAKPECPYCGTTKDLRYLHKGYGPIPAEFTCEWCFRVHDQGPCFDDLPEAPSQAS